MVHVNNQSTMASNMSSNNANASTSTSFIMLFVMGWGLLLIWAFVRSIQLCIKRFLGDDEGGRIAGEESPECYRTMSFARQEEIDNLRKTALLRYLNRYTLTLDDEHLLCCSGSQTDSTHSSSTNEVYDDNESLTSGESCEDVERSGDVEEGNSDVVLVRNGGDMTQAHDSKSTAAGDAAVEYTHISIPLPGFDVAGKNDICSTEARKESRPEGKGKRWKLPSLFQSGDDNGRETSQAQTEPVSVTNKPNSEPQTVQKRNVPIFCAICLSEFEKCDCVCWSSNAECSHVFHEDCILQWLTSSGKKRSMSQYFTRNPTYEELLKNEFCPCCRQEFICVKQAPALLGSDESV